MQTHRDGHRNAGDHAPSDQENRRIRLCVIVTVDITLLNLCRGRFEYLTRHGFDITAVCAPTAQAAEIESRGVRLHTVSMNRAMTPLRDVVAIWRLVVFLRRERFDVIEVSTPKAALVGSIAAWLARAPAVVHLLRGLVYDNQKGLRRWLLKLSQAIPCRLAHEVISISPSMADQASKDGLCEAKRVRVLGHGSSNGVDLDHFIPGGPNRGRELRRSICIPEGAIVVGFVGRMTGDKGIAELVQAFTRVSADRAGLYLLLVGEYESRDRPDTEVMETISRHPRIRHVGWQRDTASYLASMDLLVLPTHREGFGTVLLEAAAMGLPTIATDIVGCRDAVVADETALVVPACEAPALAGAMARLADDESLRKRLGANGRHRAEAYFAQETVWSLQEEALRQLADRAGPLRPRSLTPMSETSPL